PRIDVTYDIELLSVLKAPPTPADLTTPPASVVRLPSGLLLQVLKPAKGTVHPTPQSRVTLHLTGWKAHGALIESTAMANHPAGYDLASVIPGWREGLLQMAEGEPARLWIPAALAYGEKPRGRAYPAGDLVYDLELLSVH